MSDATERTYTVLSAAELVERAYTDAEAMAAVLEALIIEDSGGCPEIGYSKVLGYHVRDKADDIYLVN